MKLKLDENLPWAAARSLREAGHDACTVHDQDMVGSPGTDVASVCRQEGRTLVTLDLDFGQLDRFPPADYPGIVIIRPREPPASEVMRLIERVMDALAGSSPDRSLWFVTEQRLRVRR